MSTTPPLGYIIEEDRTPAQQRSHENIVNTMQRFQITAAPHRGPVKVQLTKLWKDSRVVSDVGFAFNRFRQITGSCFPAGTPVRMADGTEKPVESVAVGDAVVTHTGKSRRVVETMTRPYTGEMVTLNVSGFPFPLEMTADHQVAIVPSRCDWRWQPDGEIEWKRADEIGVDDRVILGWSSEARSGEVLDTLKLLGEYAVDLDELMKDNAFTKGNEPDAPHANFSSARTVVRNSGVDWRGRVRLHKSRASNAIYRLVAVCPSLGRLIGIYLAEGGCHGGRVTFTFHAKERATLAAETLALVEGLFGVTGEIETAADRPNTCKVRFQNINLAAFFKSICPGDVYSKRVPGFIVAADEQTKLATLLGWLAGDGYTGIHAKSARITGVSVCAGLARDMATLAISCGIKATVGRRKARGISRVSYSVDLSGGKALSMFPVLESANTHRVFATDTAKLDHGYARRVRSVTRRHVETLPVFDFEVEEDHSFLAGGITVHNCVGAGGGQALFTLGAVQRCLPGGATKAFIPFWPFNYGRSRAIGGDRGPGEGSLGSWFAQTVAKEGIIGIHEAGLPTFDRGDGLALTEQQEMAWSDGNSQLVTAFLDEAKPHPLGTAAPMRSPDDMRTAIINGYPGTFACDRFIGKAAIVGSGADAVCVGKWDGQGGHQQSFHDYWDHPSLGPLFGILNNWPADTYPADPGGLPTCACWVKEADVAEAMRYHAEVYAFSHLSWFPAQPAVLDWSSILP